jgi:hypothetical protein
MSVQLCVMKDKGCEAVELMASDYGAKDVWLWLEEDGANRIDLSEKQARELRDALDELLAPMTGRRR